MSSLILLGERPSSHDLAALLERVVPASASAGLAQLAESKKLAALLDTGLFANQAALLTASEEDLTAALALGFAVLAQLSSAAEAAAATTKFATLLTTEPTVRSSLKVRTLTHLINVVGTLSTVAPAQRFALLLQLHAFALAAPTTITQVLQPLATIQSVVDFWKLTPDQALALYTASYKLALVAPPRKQRVNLESGDAPAQMPTIYQLGTQPALHHEYLLAVLKAIDAAGAPAIQAKENQELAVTAVLAAISNGLASTVHALDASAVYPLAVVQSLSSSSTGATAFELLRIVVQADLAAFATFEKKNGAFLKEQQLDAVTFQRKLRTLALGQLAVMNPPSTTGDNILAYDAIRKALQLSAGADEVEAAVIDAVMAGRLDAKMDQETETLLVKRVTGGVPLSLYTGPNARQAFGALAQRLKAWKSNIHTVLTTLNLSQPQPVDQDGPEDIQ